MKKLFAFLFVAVLLTGCGTEEKKTDKTEETMDEYIDEVIEESMESSRIRSVESYMAAVEAAATTYMTLNPDVTNVTICTGAGPAANCEIDATDAGRTTPNSSSSAKVVKYSGDKVLCESATYDNETGLVTVSKCTVGDDTKNVYSGNTTDGLKKVK